MSDTLEGEYLEGDLPEKPQNPVADTPDEDMTDDQVISFTQRTRRRFLKHMLEGGFPNDEKEQRVLLTALSDMDRTAIGNKRIGAAEKQSQSDTLVAQTLAELGRQFGANNPFQSDSPETVNDFVPPPRHELPPANAVPGETDIGVSDVTYEEFTKRYDETHDTGQRKD